MVLKLPSELLEVVDAILESMDVPFERRRSKRRNIVRIFQKHASAVLQYLDLAEWPPEEPIRYVVFVVTLHSMAAAGFRATLDLAFASRARALAHWKQHLATCSRTTGQLVPWMGTVQSRTDIAAGQGCAAHLGLPVDASMFYPARRWWQTVTLQPCRVQSVRVQPVTVQPVTVQPVCDELQSASISFSHLQTEQHSTGTATSIVLSTSAVTIIQPCMTVAGETWELAGSRMETSRSLRRTITPNTKRYPGSVDLNTTSTLRVNAPPSFPFPRKWMACPKGPRVLVNRSNLESLGGGGKWWETIDTASMQVGVSIVVHTTNHQIHSIAHCVSTAPMHGVSRACALEAQHAMRQLLLVAGVLEPEPEFNELMGDYMQLGCRGKAGKQMHTITPTHSFSPADGLRPVSPGPGPCYMWIHANVDVVLKEYCMPQCLSFC